MPRFNVISGSSNAGPWFPARFEGECDGCFAPIDEGDEIRADGSGGWIGRCCDWDQGPQDGPVDEGMR